MTRIEAFIRWLFNDSDWSDHKQRLFRQWFKGKEETK